MAYLWQFYLEKLTLIYAVTFLCVGLPFDFLMFCLYLAILEMLHCYEKLMNKIKNKNTGI
jgi:hypothetical protein